MPEEKDFIPPRRRFQGETSEEAIKRGRTEFKEALDRFQKKATEYPLLSDIAPQMEGLLESACNIRFSQETQVWRPFVKVRALAERGEDGVPRYDLYRHKKLELADGGKINENYRMAWRRRYPGQPIPDDPAEFDARWSGMTEKDWQRAPKDRAHHGVRDDEIDQGQRRVWADLDTREFIDPIQFGEPPTTAGIMVGEDGGSACAVLLSTFHPDSRGGGDIDQSECFIVGRWRNHRIILTAENEEPHSGFPSTAEVLESFTNVSSEFQREASRALDD